MKKIIIILILNIVLISIIFFIGETYLRNRGAKGYVRTFPGQYQNDPRGDWWAKSDSFLGWTSNENHPEINPQGFRDVKDFNLINIDSSKKRVMVLGDAYMWGAGLGLDENIPNLLQKKFKE